MAFQPIKEVSKSYLTKNWNTDVFFSNDMRQLLVDAILLRSIPTFLFYDTMYLYSEYGASSWHKCIGLAPQV